MFIGGSCDIGFLSSNMRIDAYGASYHMEFRNQDFENKRWSYEENIKVVPQLRKALASKQETIKMFIGGSCDIGCLCSNMRIEAYGASYHMELKK